MIPSKRPMKLFPGDTVNLISHETGEAIGSYIYGGPKRTFESPAAFRNWIDKYAQRKPDGSWV